MTATVSFIHQPITTVKQAADAAVNKTWDVTKRIWEQTPNLVKWILGFSAAFIALYGIGYSMGAFLMWLLMGVLGLPFGLAYGLTLALTLGTVYGLIFHLLSLHD